jgi:predicted alpha/beta superfamily hydrolase
VYPFFDPSQAQGRREDYSLPGPFGGTRTLRTWLPPGYDENTAATYPLLLMHDGQNLFEDETASFGVSWQLDEAAQKSWSDAKLQEVVIVGVDHAGKTRIYEYTPWVDQEYGDGGGGATYVAWLNSTVVPDAQKRYRLQAGREGRVMGGSSLGGLISCYALFLSPETWSGGACLSGTWMWANYTFATWVVQHPPPKNLPVRVWLDAGTDNDELADTQQTKGVLMGLGLTPPDTLGYLEVQGGNHSETAWAARAHLVLQFFFDAKDRALAF